MIAWYGALKALHVVLVLLSGLGFAWRGALMLRGSAWLHRRAVRVLPHVVDTLLLASGIGLAALAHFDPLRVTWLGAKLLALVGYIVLGAVALRRGPTRPLRACALAGALVLYACIVTTALNKNAAWPLAWLS